VRATASAGGQPLPITPGEQLPENKILSRNRRRTVFYIVRFHGPITETRREELRTLEISLLERLTNNKYTVRLKPPQVKALAEKPFVDAIRLYTAADTLRVREIARDTPAGADAQQAAAGATPRTQRPRRTAAFAVRVHRAKDLKAVLEWLDRRKHKPIWSRDDQLQIALFENSRILRDLAARPEVAVVEQVEAPRLCDGPARALLGLVQGAESIGLTGEGEVIAVADTGIDNQHPDLVNQMAGLRARGRPDDTSDPEGHGTHVAGCAAGDGTASNGAVLGAAPGAKIFFQSILDSNGGLGGLPNDLGQLLQEAYDSGARIHNNSWGAFSYARYSNRSLDVDRFVADHPDMLVVIAAGNDGIGIPRKAGTKMCAAQGFVDWACVGAPATAKNGLTVGASRSSRTTGGYAGLTWGDVWPDRYPHPPIAQDRISSNDQSLAAFSSRGPVENHQIKPDVVAPGTDIAAARSQDAPLYKFWGAYPKNSHYAFMGGTSMAAPYVAGCAALVRQWYRTMRDWPTSSAALIKATLINGARWLTGADAVAPLEGEPNFHQGFGRIDMAQTIPSPLAPELMLVFTDTWTTEGQTFEKTGQRFRCQVDVGPGLPLRLCLAWTDFGANGLQNSLRLLVDNTNQTKWAGNAQAATMLNVAGGPRDTRNNVQVVRIEKPPPAVYTIVVTADMLAFPPQTFALVVTGDLKSDLIPYP
jgi:serine protease AprX